MSPAPLGLEASILATLATLPTTTPTVAQVASELGRPESRLRGVLDRLERTGIVEQWPDPENAGSVRVMLSARSAGQLGLRLSARGDRWSPKCDPRRPAR